MSRLRKGFSAVLLAAALCSEACSRTPKLEFCVKPSAEGAAVEDCGTVFTPGELIIRQKLSAKHGKMELYFYDMQDEDQTPLDIIPVEPDAGGSMLLYEISIYDEGKYRFELHGEKGKIGEGVVTIVEKRKVVTE